MIEIFLIWTLFGGLVHDVDSFVDRDQCLKVAAEWQVQLAEVVRQRPEMASVQIVSCQAVKLAVPQTPEIPKQSM